MNLERARRFLHVGLGMLLVGGVVLGWTVWHNDFATMSTAAGLTFFGSVMAVFFGLLVAYGGGRALRLSAASQAIARWLVSAEEWQRYVAACRAREMMAGAFPGAVPLDVPVPPQGIDVLALRRGFRIGDSFHEVGTITAEVIDMRVVDSPVAMFEFNVRYATGETSSVQQGLRIPIAAGAQALANQVEDYWVARQPLQTMTRDQLRSRERTSWAICFFGLAALIGVVALFTQINPPGWAAIGPLSAITLALFGFVRGFAARMVRLRKHGNS